MTLSRRALIGGGVAALGLGWRARAQDPAPLPLLGGRMRAVPDFDRLASTPHRVGVRPHRVGGVRVELDQAVLSGAPAPKTVVHHYGHGAAGITLSLGVSEYAADLVDRALEIAGTRSIAVLGTGIIGLTTAWAVQRRHPDVAIRIYAKDLDVSTTTSHVAGGQFEPSTVWRDYQDDHRKALFHGWLRTARARIAALEPQWTRYGIAPRDNFTLDHDVAAMAYAPPDVIAPAELGRLPFPDLQVPGRLYRTFLINPTIFLPAVVAELTDRGVGFAQRTFTSLQDVAALDERVVVNCTGYGAKALWGDDALIGQRGHLVVLERGEDPDVDWLFGGGCDNDVISYTFCRQHDVVVGGTFLVNQDSNAITAEDDAVFARLRSNARELFAGHPAACAR